MLALAVGFESCGGEDRSGEMPQLPKVKTLSAEVVGDSCVVTGLVVESANSRVVNRGITYGNDTLRAEAEASDTLETFRAATARLQSGTYFVAAYAENGMGKAYGDTILFTIP